MNVQVVGYGSVTWWTYDLSCEPYLSLWFSWSRHGAAPESKPSECVATPFEREWGEAITEDIHREFHWGRFAAKGSQ